MASIRRDLVIRSFPAIDPIVASRTSFAKRFPPAFMDRPMDLILASTSTYRRALVERLGIPFRCVAPPVDEPALKARWEGVGPRELAERLAIAKAAGVASTEPDAAVIGGDQLVALDGSTLGKPGTAEQAVAQLRAMSGRSHELITAIVVLHRGRTYASHRRNKTSHASAYVSKRFTVTSKPTIRSTAPGATSWKPEGLRCSNGSSPQTIRRSSGYR